MTPNPEADALSRVSAHAAPPDGVTVNPAEFHGPLFAHWGPAMRAEALRSTLGGVAAADLRDRVGILPIDRRDRWAQADPITIERIMAAAGNDRGRPWPDALGSLFARYVRDGDRATYERAVSDRQERLTRAVIAAAVTDDPAWIDEAGDGVVVLCEQSTWSLPAHDDAHARRGFVLPDVDAPYLDLIAGEIVAQLAVADRILGARWDARWPGLRERIRREAEARVFTPFETRDDLWWLGYWRDVNNWNPWILGNTLLAAVLLLDDAARVARMLARALDSLDRYVAELPADGAIDEGVAYWWNGAGRMLEMLDTVAAITGGRLDAAGIPVVAETLRFPMRMHLGGDWYVNVADGWARSRGHEPWQLPFRWGGLTADAQVADWARAARRPGAPAADVAGGLPRLVRALADPAWRDAAPAAPPLPAAVWLPSVQVLVRRGEAGSATGLALAAKGGTNDENHNHKDLGSFLVAAGGRQLLVDVGKPTYTAQTFSAGRYRIRAMQSGWHSAPAPFGLEQGEGPAFAARVITAPQGEPGPAPSTDSGTAEFELELAGAYPLAEGDSWRRRFRFAGSGSGSASGSGSGADRIEVTDRWRLREDGAHRVHLIAAGDVVPAGSGLEVGADGHRIRITADDGTGPVAPALEVWELDDPELIAVWGPRLTRLVYAVSGRSGTLATVIEELS
ncbi:MAG: heparinase II/III family protein [Actinobacteria bacterium]|nr:heparinase II/III family protein [Actinomycetota bacterium]